MISCVSSLPTIKLMSPPTTGTIKRNNPSSSSSQEEPALKKRKGVIVRGIDIKPIDYIKCAFKANGVVNLDAIKIADTEFVLPTKEEIAAYRPELLNCVRQNDLVKLRALHKEGKVINCSNKFGESLLHLACRRSYTEIVEFLIKEAKVNVNIRDDYRRTPLHDACWTIEPNFALVDMLIKLYPEHMVMEDVRGFTPFDYVRHEHKGKWLHFLWQRRSIMRPREDPDHCKTTPGAV
jgi:hypothetical protein